MLLPLLPPAADAAAAAAASAARETIESGRSQLGRFSGHSLPPPFFLLFPLN
jgi:hypothetical protein